MARISFSRTVDLPVDICWRRVTAWDRHGDRVPLTRVFVARGDGRGRGDVIVARTGIGPLGFDDPMEIAELRTPEQSGDEGGSGFCRLVKHGRVVRGWAELSVVPVGAGARTAVRWEEELRIIGVPRFADPLVAAVGRAVFGRALDHLLRGAPG